MTITLSFTPTREAALQRECDALNAANGKNPLTLEGFAQLLMDARADQLLVHEAAAAEATPQKVQELKEVIRQKDEEIARLMADGAKAIEAEPAPLEIAP